MLLWLDIGAVTLCINFPIFLSTVPGRPLNIKQQFPVVVLIVFSLKFALHMHNPIPLPLIRCRVSENSSVSLLLIILLCSSLLARLLRKIIRETGKTQRLTEKRKTYLILLHSISIRFKFCFSFYAYSNLPPAFSASL